jgi:hypothetical protein
MFLQKFCTRYHAFPLFLDLSMLRGTDLARFFKSQAADLADPLSP